LNLKSAGKSKSDRQLIGTTDIGGWDRRLEFAGT
jgi:hypothetical protein